MFERVVFNYKDLEVRVSDHVNEEILYLLDHTIQGSEGGMRYSLQNVAPRIEAYKDKIRFVSLYKKNQVTGTIGSCFRISGQGLLLYPSTYLRYLSIQSTYQLEPGWRKRHLFFLEKVEPLSLEPIRRLLPPNIVRLSASSQ